MRGRKLKNTDVSGLPSKKVCNECEDRKEISCFYIQEYVSSITGRSSFYASCTCKECQRDLTTKRLQKRTPEEVKAYKQYQKNYHLNRKQNKYI